MFWEWGMPGFRSEQIQQSRSQSAKPSPVDVYEPGSTFKIVAVRSHERRPGRSRGSDRLFHRNGREDRGDEIARRSSSVGKNLGKQSDAEITTGRRPIGSHAWIAKTVRILPVFWIRAKAGFGIGGKRRRVASSEEVGRLDDHQVADGACSQFHGHAGAFVDGCRCKRGILMKPQFIHRIFDEREDRGILIPNQFEEW